MTLLSFQTVSRYHIFTVLQFPVFNPPGQSLHCFPPSFQESARPELPVRHSGVHEADAADRGRLQGRAEEVPAAVPLPLRYPERHRASRKDTAQEQKCELL